MHKKKKNNRVIFIEGARNVGKTFLIDKVKDVASVYKFPFAKYFNESFTHGVPDENKQAWNVNKELFYLTIGYDITVLDLMKQGLIKHDIIVDRGLLSDIVFGIQSNRVHIGQAKEAWNWLVKEYGDFFEIVYITAKERDDNRDKDIWDHYDQKETIALTTYFLNEVNYKPNIINNMFTEESSNNFRSYIIDLITK